MRYLLGPGRDNEHTNPHLVAGDERIMLGYAGRELTVNADANPLGHAVDYARATHDRQPSDGATVWHTSLSLAAVEGELTDEQWQRISDRFMELMGFAGDEQPGLRWAAVHHGLSSNGNDHVHIVASRVTDDGSLADWHYDMPRSQRAARQLEREFGLRRLGTNGNGMPGYSQGEARRSKQQGQPTRVRIEPKVRAAAESASNESEFVSNLRTNGLLVRPRYEQGGTNEVVGYSVAVPPTKGDRQAGATKPVWFGGGRLARDLTLPNLRERWNSTPADQQAAVPMWHRHNGAGPNETVQHKRVIPQQADWQRIDHEISQLANWINQLDPNDLDGWRHAAGQVAGGFASLANRFEQRRGPLGTTARELARCAQPPRDHTRHSTSSQPQLRATNVLLMHTATGHNSAAGWMAVMRQLERTSQAVTRSRALANDASHAQQRADDAVRRVNAHHSTYQQAIEATSHQPGRSDGPAQPQQRRSRARSHRNGPEQGRGPRR